MGFIARAVKRAHLVPRESFATGGDYSVAPRLRSAVMTNVPLVLPPMKAILSCCAWVALVASAGAQTFSYSNADFINGTWSIVAETGAGGSTGGASQATNGGNPGNYLSVVNHSNNEGISTFTFFPASVFHPSTQGAITSVDLSFDAIMLGSDGQGFSAALRQGGVNYLIIPENTSYPASWTNASWLGVTASNFGTWADNSAHPDFSTSGGPIEFGFSNSNGAFGFRTTSSGYDNFSVAVSFTAIPEPATYAALLGAGAVGFAAWRRRRTVA